ncbi:hypothetical protein [Thiorhodovibrio frisius]|uniref:hypothetical protein n=1 Tax=Thiorhodovibrio frisius TaxID=631362 RepID=UPI00030A52A1|nr:hypothetical protein [Thiorhodovibrio frisius]
MTKLNGESQNEKTASLSIRKLTGDDSHAADGALGGAESDGLTASQADSPTAF